MLRVLQPQIERTGGSAIVPIMRALFLAPSSSPCWQGQRWRNAYHYCEWNGLRYCAQDTAQVGMATAASAGCSNLR